MPNGLPNASDDARLELAMAAMRSERRNRPRYLVLIALLVLVVAVVNLLWTFTSRAAAAASLSRATASLANIQGVISQLQTLEERRTSPKFDPDNDMEGKLSRYAMQLGLPRVEVAAKEPTSSLKGFRKRTYTTQVQEQDPDLLLSWITKSTDGVTFPGLEVEQLKLVPGRVLESGKVGWTLDITFRRWERLP
jgi:hypothetical protein